MVLSAWLPLDQEQASKEPPWSSLSSLVTELGTIMCGQTLWSLPPKCGPGLAILVQPLPRPPLSLCLPHGPEIADPAITNIQQKHFEGTS